MTATANLTFHEMNHQFFCEGDWTIYHVDSLRQKFKTIALPGSKKITIDGSQLKQLDSAGALTLLQCAEEFERSNNQVQWVHFSTQQQELLTLVKDQRSSLTYQAPTKPRHGTLYYIGREAVNKINQVDGLIVLIGDLTVKLVSAFGQWRRFRSSSVVSNIASAGLKALPIVGLLSFLIGVVLAYQMGLQLQTYGANIFIAYLSGMAIFREFSPLITAIIVAGRTSSAFTAQIGSMKINEEIDALYTMGLSPTELLVVPKVLGLLLIFPLLIFWSDFFSTLGAMMMSKSMLNVGYIDFLTRLRESVGLKQLMLGLYKAPTFAILIALVGCFQGFRVQLNADSVGTQTTKSVVQALFLIIVVDAAYSIIYSWLGL